MTNRTITSFALGLLAFATAAEARAAGLYIEDRGVRPMGRGGAFVAGADDLGAIWYNPAGLVDAPSSILIDGTYLDYTTSYTRQTLSTSSTGTTFNNTLPTVHGSTPFLPLPTIAISHRFGSEKQFAIAAGIYAPMAGLMTYPRTITNADGSQGSAPQRYSLISLNGSILVTAGLWFAWKPVEQLRIGAGVQMLTGSFKATLDLSACPPDNFACAAEDPAYDAYSQVSAGPIFAPTANAGVTYVPDRMVRFGLSGQAPVIINSPATVQLQLPAAPEFENASMQGNQAHVRFELPPVFRAGIEVRPLDEAHDLRVELAYVREFWSVQQSMQITPQNLALANVTGFPSPFGVSAISIPRGGQDSNSVRFGGEYKFALFDDYKAQLRAGVAYETSGIQTPYVSAFTIDSNKVLVSIGGGIFIGEHLRLDGVLSHSFISNVYVSPQEAAVPRVNPVLGNPTATTAVNGGSYTSQATSIGGGLEYRF